MPSKDPDTGGAEHFPFSGTQVEAEAQRLTGSTEHQEGSGFTQGKGVLV